MGEEKLWLGTSEEASGGAAALKPSTMLDKIAEEGSQEQPSSAVETVQV
jgi:hypothetical protein